MGPFIVMRIKNKSERKVEFEASIKNVIPNINIISQFFKLRV